MSSLENRDIKVIKTAFSPLISRVHESHSKDPIFEDAVAEKWLKELGQELQVPASSFAAKANIIRTKIIDDLLQKEIDKEDELTVVNLGCGFDTRYYRTKNVGKLTWIDIDFKNNIDLKRTLVSNQDSYHLMDGSILDDFWVEKVNELASGKIIFVIEGVLPYLKESEVRNLFGMIKQNFSNYKIFCTLVSNFFVKIFSSKFLYIGDIKYQWGIKDDAFFRDLGFNYKEYPYILFFPKKWKKYNFLKHFSLIRNTGRVMEIWPS